MATMARPGKKRAESAIEEAGGDVRRLFPTRLEEDQIGEYMAAVPPEHHDRIWNCAKHIANTTHRAMAAAAGALVMQQMFEPNSSFGMWAYSSSTVGAVSPLARGAAATPGAIYNFASYMAGAVRPNSGQVTFTKGQRFFGLTTGPMDSNAGWTFAGNTVMLASDAISGIETDTSFVNWRPEIVKARLIKGEYEGFAIKVETVIPFTASAYIPPGMPGVPSIEGLSVLFWDSRCLNKELTWLDFDNMDFEDMTMELVRHMDGGKINRRLLLDYVPEHRRHGR
jgi:hypothetical protein